MTTYPRTRAALFAMEQAEAELCRLIAQHAGPYAKAAARVAVGMREVELADAFAADRAGLSDPATARDTAIADRSWVRRLLQGAAA